MKTLGIISILALLTISGAAYTDQLLTSGQQATHRGELRPAFEAGFLLWDDNYISRESISRLIRRANGQQSRERDSWTIFLSK